MSASYSALLDLTRARVLVVGGGAVACRKVETLAESGARPDLIAPELTPELTALTARMGLLVRRGVYQDGDAAGYRVVFAATDRRDVNAAVARDAEAAGAWVNVADDPEASTLLVPAAVRRGEVLVALSTGGASPLLARRVRERLERVVTPGLGRAADRLRALRSEVRARWPGEEERRRHFWFALITDDFLDCAIAGRDEELENRIQACLSQSSD